jgi:hypothetical protein
MKSQNTMSEYLLRYIVNTVYSFLFVGVLLDRMTLYKYKIRIGLYLYYYQKLKEVYCIIYSQYTTE